MMTDLAAATNLWNDEQPTAPPYSGALNSVWYLYKWQAWSTRGASRGMCGEQLNGFVMLQLGSLYSIVRSRTELRNTGRGGYGRKAMDDICHFLEKPIKPSLSAIVKYYSMRLSFSPWWRRLQLSKGKEYVQNAGGREEVEVMEKAVFVIERALLVWI